MRKFLLSTLARAVPRSAAAAKTTDARQREGTITDGQLANVVAGILAKGEEIPS